MTVTARQAVREAVDPHLGPPKLLTVEQTAYLTNLGTTTVEKLVASGELPSIKVGKCRRVLASSIDAFIQRRLGEGMS
jgi:excisionase family DNA binding protein